MSDDSKLPYLEIQKVFNRYAAEIFSARQKAKIIHGAGNIDSAGEEVEQTVRQFFRDRLSEKYHVGHGHIIDAGWTCSPQVDIVISEKNIYSPLFSTEDGTEYYPSESVYAFGEVKTTYNKSRNYICDFSDTIRKIKDNIHRAEFTGPGGRTLNPLFSFILFVDSNDFDPQHDDSDAQHLDNIYEDKEWKYLPNFACILDKGVIQNANFSPTGSGQIIPRFYNIHPENKKEEAEIGGRNWWAFQKFGNEGNRSWANLCMMYYTLASHLESTKVKSPSLDMYLGESFWNLVEDPESGDMRRAYTGVAVGVTKPLDTSD